MEKGVYFLVCVATTRHMVALQHRTTPGLLPQHTFGPFQNFRYRFGQFGMNWAEHTRMVHDINDRK